MSFSINEDMDVSESYDDDLDATEESISFDEQFLRGMDSNQFSNTMPKQTKMAQMSVLIDINDYFACKDS